MKSPARDGDKEVGATGSLTRPGAPLSAAPTTASPEGPAGRAAPALATTGIAAGSIGPSTV
ncbi:hypothetical protein [Streptomyces tauricus]|uniref:hypothetical protein n=1 Tax=Streptomyces tauricus TaxID=68274 RepID=UPI00381951ED